MAEYKGKVENSSQIHIKEENTANMTKPENNLKNAKWATYTWGRREDHAEKGQVAELQLSPSQPQPTGWRKRNGWERIVAQECNTPGPGDLLQDTSPHYIGFW